MPKGPSLRACSLLYNMMSTTKSLIFQDSNSHYKMAPDTLAFRARREGRGFPGAAYTDHVSSKHRERCSSSRRALRQQSLARSGPDWTKQIRFVVLSI